VNNCAVLAVVAVPHDATFSVLQVVEGGFHNIDVVRVDEPEFVYALPQNL
jgi:hypothetical protein